MRGEPRPSLSMPIPETRRAGLGASMTLGAFRSFAVSLNN